MIIGLDVATVTGIAVGEPGSKPLCWSQSLREAGVSHDARFSQALQLTLRLIKEYQPALIAIEAPIKTRHDKTGNLGLLMGLQGAIRGACHLKNVPTLIPEISDIDMAFLNYRAKGRKERKAAIRARCSQLGWKFSDEDAADAAAVWNYACSTLSRSHSLQTTPLFGGA